MKLLSENELTRIKVEEWRKGYAEAMKEVKELINDLQIRVEGALKR